MHKHAIVRHRAFHSIPQGEDMDDLTTPGGEAESGGTYALGHSAQELERLRIQARLIDPITRRFFLEAGLGPGMRVLDIGSGAGDVAFLAAELVGVTGEVVGTDRAAKAVAAARERHCGVTW